MPFLWECPNAGARPEYLHCGPGTGPVYMASQLCFTVYYWIYSSYLEWRFFPIFWPSGFQAPHGGVIPPDVLVTNLKPDLFLVNMSSRVIVFLELTCPFDRNIQRSHEYKEQKYAPLIADLSQHFKVFNYSFEVSARGQVTKQNRARLKSFLHNCCAAPRNSVMHLIRICSKASLLSSYSIFSARKEPSWTSPNPLIVR